MSTTSAAPIRSALYAGRLTYAFERLYCTVVTDGEADYRPVYGSVLLAYDGKGAWWPEHITLHSRHWRRPDIDVDPAAPLGREIAARLVAECDEDIADAIKAALAAGEHMRIFGEALPPETARRGPPPHVAPRLRLATRRAFDATLEFVCFVLMMAIVAATLTIPQLPWPGHRTIRLTVTTPHAIVLAAAARLDRVNP